MAHVNKLIVSFIFVIAIGCAPENHAKKGSIASWEKKLGMIPSKNLSKSLKRGVAQNAPRCLKDRINPLWIREEALRLEAAQSGPALEGTVYGIDLSTLPAPQARFLLYNQEWIAPEPLENAQCTDLICVIKAIYGSETDEEAWKVYGFYLKTGYMLSLRNGHLARFGTQRIEVPNDPITNFLISNEYLTAFWKIAWILPPALVRMPVLDRLISTETVPTYWPERACGIAQIDRRHITVLQRCIQFDPPGGDSYRRALNYGEYSVPINDGIRDYSYQTYIHEMAHHFDSMSRTNHSEVYLSRGSDWRALSGWYKEEPTDPASGRVVSSNWLIPEGVTNFARTYSRTNPVEDFADAVSFARLYPHHLARVAPEKLAFVREKVFSGRTFDTEGLKRYYTRRAFHLVMGDGSEILNACANETSLTESECLSQMIRERLPAAFDEIRATEWEACDILNVRGVESTLIGQVIAGIPELVQVVRDTIELRNLLTQENDVREAYVYCSRYRHRQEECYRFTLGTAFDRQAVPYLNRIGAAELARERENYIETVSYQEAANQTVEFYQNHFGELRQRVSEAANSRWNQCLGSPDPSSEYYSRGNVYRPFDGGAQFVAYNILACINESAYLDIDGLSDTWITERGLDVPSDVAKEYIRNLLLPTYLESLQRNLAQATEEEARVRSEIRVSIVSTVSELMMVSTSWVRRGQSITLESARTRCPYEAGLEIRRQISRLNYPQRFHDEASEIDEIKNEVCTLIFSSTQINDIVQTVFTEVRSENLAVLRNSMDISIMNRREECEEQIRGNRNSASVKRRILQCIRDDNFWESEFTIVFNHWIQHTFYRVLTQEQVLEYLQTNRNERIDVVASSLLPPAPRPRNTNPRRR